MRLGQSIAVIMWALIFLPSLTWGQDTASNPRSVSATNQTEPWPTLVADYTPYLHGQPWPSIPIVRYFEINTNLHIWGHPASPKKFPTMQEVHDSDADFATVILRMPSGEIYKTYNDFVLGPYLAAVYSGDFNGDGVPDFFAIKPTCGNGIAGEQALGVFAFSDGTNGYRFTRVRGWGLGRHSLVMDPVTRTFRFMHTTFCDAEGTDGRYHSFWVHQFYKWEGGNMSLDDKYSAIWIQYLFRTNHEPTKLLTPEIKAKAWAEEQERHDSIEY